jgi:hypothetical protein
MKVELVANYSFVFLSNLTTEGAKQAEIIIKERLDKALQEALAECEFCLEHFVAKPAN